MNLPSGVRRMKIRLTAFFLLSKKKCPSPISLGFLLTIVSMCSLPAAPAKGQEELSVYFVGNSMVRSITPTRLHELVEQRGIDLQFGSQLKGVLQSG